MLPRRRVLWIAAALIVLAVSTSVAGQRGQRRGGDGGFGFFGSGSSRNLPYDGKFVVARIQYANFPGWSYDYPAMERHFTTLLDVLTSIEPHVDGSNVHRLDDPELTKYPIAYLSEPGYWYPNDAEVDGLRRYLKKGGFLIVDDFHYANEWYVFEQAMRRVIPEAQIERLDRSHPIFNSFFEIESLDLPYPSNPSLYGEFYGIHEDNDPTRRLSVIVNYNMDIGDYMEWSDQSVYEFASTNEAYKFGINYVVYGLTH